MVILSACSSISQSTNLEKSYIGKLNLSQNNLVSKFIIRINVFSEDTIIQVSKPILGNLIKIKFNQKDGITTNQELDSSILTAGISTYIVITSDHGQEFNDLNKNYWEHPSNFAQYQTKVPLVMHWPGKSPQQWQHRTSHCDIAATLMPHLLGITNPLFNVGYWIRGPILVIFILYYLDKLYKNNLFYDELLSLILFLFFIPR